jgi:hypothetical protein
MREPLIACASCARHVRVSDGRCPFCQAELPKAAPVRGTPIGTFGRAALVIAGAAAGAAVPLAAGCSSEPPIVVGDAYGLPPPDVLIVGDAYGLPPPDVRPPPVDDGGDGGDGGDATTDGPGDAEAGGG